MLSRAYRSTRSEFIPIYGRRRVGKSELVLRFMEDKPGVLLPRAAVLGRVAGKGVPARGRPRARHAAPCGASCGRLAAGGSKPWSSNGPPPTPGRSSSSPLTSFSGSRPRAPDFSRVFSSAGTGAGGTPATSCCSCAVRISGSWSGRCSGRRARCSAGAPPRFTSNPSAISRRPSSIRAGRSWIGRGPTFWSAVCRNTCSAWTTPGPSTSTSGNQSSTSSRRCSTSRRSCSARSFARSHPTRRSFSRSLRGGAAACPPSRDATELPGRNLHYYLEQLVNLGYLRRRYPLDRRRRKSQAGAIRYRRPAAPFLVPFRCFPT